MSQKSKVELQKSAEHPDSNRRFRRQPNGSAAGGSSRRSDEFANQPCRRLGQDSWGFVELTGGMWSGSGIMICQCGRDSMVEFQLPNVLAGTFRSLPLQIHFLNNPTSEGFFLFMHLRWDGLAKREKHWKFQPSSRAFQPRIPHGDDRSRRRYANARTVGRRPQGNKAPLPTAISKPPDLPRRGSAADGRKKDDMQDDSRRQPEGRDGQDRHGAEPGGRARQDGEPGASRRRRSPGRPDEVPRMEGPGLA